MNMHPTFPFILTCPGLSSCNVALAEAVSESTPEVDDVTTFHPEDTEKLRMAKEVAADLKSVRSPEAPKCSTFTTLYG